MADRESLESHTVPKQHGVAETLTRDGTNFAAYIQSLEDGISELVAVSKAAFPFLFRHF